MLSIINSTITNSTTNETTSAVSYFNEPDSYQQSLRQISETNGIPSTFSDFDFYHAEGHDHLFMKQEIDSTIEMAAQCGYNQKFTKQTVGSLEDECSPCLTDGFANRFTLSNQAKSCWGCAEIFEFKNTENSIAQLFF